MQPVTPRTSIAELRARVRSAEARGVDQTARLVRSVQQSLRVEGYEVGGGILLRALEQAQQASKGQCSVCSR